MMNIVGFATPRLVHVHNHDTKMLQLLKKMATENCFILVLRHDKNHARMRSLVMP